MSCHIVDWMCAMCGEVDTVRALSAPQKDPRYDFPETLHVTLSFRSGAIATLTVSLVFPLWKFREAGGPLVITENGAMRFEPYMDHLDLYWQSSEDSQPTLERFDDLGFDHAINYKTDDLDKSLKSLCPEGVDIYFDNVAGDILDTVLQNLALYARIPLCGLLAQYNEKGSRLPGPDNFDQLLMKRASITGFFCPDFLDDGPKIEKIMHDWYLEGSLKFKADVTNGLENVLVSYKRMFNGDNVGKTLVKL